MNHGWVCGLVVIRAEHLLVGSMKQGASFSYCVDKTNVHHNKFSRWKRCRLGVRDILRFMYGKSALLFLYPAELTAFKHAAG